MTALHEKYRPKSFKEVVGQQAAVKSLQGTIKRRSSQAFLFSGPAGTGKTTLARITASALGCLPGSIQELPAAVYTGVGDMRPILQSLAYKPFGASPGRALILDEAHRLSGNAWDSLLKAMEEPPEEVYWFLCTTAVSKVPQTIKTRCTHIQLKEIPDKELDDLLLDVCETEGFEVPEDVASLVVKEARGSARQMLVYLDACRDCKTKQEAASVLKTALDTDATIELCRKLASGVKWSQAMALVEKLENENPEGVRIIVVNYMAKALRSAKSERDAAFFLNILDCFATPYKPEEGIAPLLLSIGRVVFPA